MVKRRKNQTHSFAESLDMLSRLQQMAIDSLLFLGRMNKLLIACMREVQESIKDSVHKLLSDRIDWYELSDYKVLQNKIINAVTGTEFIFKGLSDKSAQNIKSL